MGEVLILHGEDLMNLKDLVLLPLEVSLLPLPVLLLYQDMMLKIMNIMPLEVHLEESLHHLVARCLEENNLLPGALDYLLLAPCPVALGQDTIDPKEQGHLDPREQGPLDLKAPGLQDLKEHEALDRKLQGLPDIKVHHLPEQKVKLLDRGQLLPDDCLPDGVSLSLNRLLLSLLLLNQTPHLPQAINLTQRIPLLGLKMKFYYEIFNPPSVRKLGKCIKYLCILLHCNSEYVSTNFIVF
jgi:hypothetical protein